MQNRWMRQAKEDLAAAKASMESDHFEWTCFQAQQAAEKAVKGFLYERGYTSIITHSLKELVAEAEKLDSDFSDVRRAARRLDAHYIPSRYPNGLAGDVSPAEFYEQEDAEECLAYAESILNVVERCVRS